MVSPLRAALHESDRGGSATNTVTSVRPGAVPGTQIRRSRAPCAHPSRAARTIGERARRKPRASPKTFGAFAPRSATGPPNLVRGAQAVWRFRTAERDRTAKPRARRPTRLALSHRRARQDRQTSCAPLDLHRARTLRAQRAAAAPRGTWSVRLEISLDSVTVRLGGVDVLRDITLTLPQGQTHALIGRSGCGKSTLLRALLGLVPTAHGTVKVGALTVTASTHRALAADVGYVIQDGGLFPHLTVRQNILLPLALQGAAPGQRLEELAALLGLDAPLLDRYPVQLSGGQRQRAALARALVRSPQVLLLDEPLGAIDPMLRSALQAELKQLFAALKMTVVLVTHDLAEAAFLASTVTLLEAGRVEQHGPVRALFEAPATPFVERFVSSQRALHQLAP
jgi:osmoprotectant transport system ATP-binding protein